MTTVRVQAGVSLLESYVRTPAVGVCELIWNAFDEDATQVDVRVERQDLGGIEAVVVVDDGRGMNREKAETGFSRVGDSWKRMDGSRSSNGRPVHGKQGRGRYAAFSIGEHVRWESVSERVEGGLGTVTIAGRRSSLDRFEISESASAAADTGTTVTITELSPDGLAAFDLSQALRQRVLAEFALHLDRFPDFRINLLGSSVDPSAVIDHREVVELVDADAWVGTATLTIIEWKLESVRRALYLCDEEGRVVDEVEPRIQAPGSEFTAYLQWSEFRRNDPLVLEDDSDTARGRLIASAREALRSFLAERARKRETETVKRWKDEGVYPYKDEPTTAIESATRDTFNVVAMAAARTLEESKSATAKGLALSLMREALENDPESLIPILRDVAKLPKARVAELADLLKRTTLTQLIQVGKEVGSRLDFLNGLETLLFGKQTRKRLLERRQLHRMLAHETWIFGEEWSLTGDDERLTKVLGKYLKLLGKGDDDVELASASPVLLEDGSDAIPDLVLGRQLATNADSYEMLVVELKRPSHKLDDMDIAQLRGYASAIVNDESFAQPNVTWEFWLVGNETTRTVDEQRTQKNLPQGVVQLDPYRIVVKTWAEIIGSGHHRLKFVQNSLQYETSHDLGLAHLREKYAEYLPDEALVQDGEMPSSGSESERTA